MKEGFSVSYEVFKRRVNALLKRADSGDRVLDFDIDKKKGLFVAILSNGYRISAHPSGDKVTVSDENHTFEPVRI